MAQPIAPVEGATITYHLGRVAVVLAVVRPGHAYRASVHHAATAGTLGAEVPELSQSWPTEGEARQAARRATVAFRDIPAEVPFAVAVEQALASIAAQLDEAIARAMGGGNATVYAEETLPRLTAAREALRTPAERIAEEELLERLRADLARYDVDARYREALADAAAQEREPVDEAEQAWTLWNDNQAKVAADRAAEKPGPPRPIPYYAGRHRAV